MELTLHLIPITPHDRALDVTWDSEAGTFTGPDGDILADLARAYAKAGTVVTHPYPTTYPCDDPFHDPAHLAAVISTRWQLPDELAGYLKAPDHRPGEVPVVY